MKRDFTSTVYILDRGKVLLIYHRKLQKWLPPGGHIDPDETPPEAALRETFEETGLKIELIPQENGWIEQANARSIERPFFCMLQDIPAHKDQPAHQHIDFQYLARPIGGEEKQNISETEGLLWFSLDEIEALEPEVEIFTATKDALRAVLQNHCNTQHLVTGLAGG